MMAVYEVKIDTLNPLHIGDGNELRKDFDFIVKNGNTRRLDVDRILESKPEALETDRYGRYPLPGALLEGDDFSNKEFFRYKLRGEPRSGKTFSEIRSCMKDAFDCPYIPGTSLKGAIRTAIAWSVWEESNVQVRISELGRNPKYADDQIEKSLFGRDPNHDLLRCLKVSDLHGGETARKRLLLANAQVITRSKQQSPIELEAVSGDSSFKGTITIDHAFLEGDMGSRLGFSAKANWLDDLPTRINQWSFGRIENLEKWFRKIPSAGAIQGFYHQLLSIKLPENRAFIQLGWGTGWDGKTYGDRLKDDQKQFEEIIRVFRLNRAGSRGNTAAAAFPSSRRVIVERESGKPIAPVGWCLFEMKKVK